MLATRKKKEKKKKKREKNRRRRRRKGAEGAEGVEEAPEAPKQHTTSDVSGPDAPPKLPVAIQKSPAKWTFCSTARAKSSCGRTWMARPQESSLTGAPKADGAALCHA